MWQAQQAQRVQQAQRERTRQLLLGCQADQLGHHKVAIPAAAAVGRGQGRFGMNAGRRATCPLAPA